MALTLTEGEKYSRTELQRGVIDRLVKDSIVLEKLPFTEIKGNSLTYNTVTTRSGAGFYAVGDTWTEDTPTLTQATATLKILGGDADVDNFIQKTRSNINDVKAEVLIDKVKAVQETFLDTFYYGDDSSNSKEFDGLQVLMTSTTYNTVHAGSGTGTALSMAKLYQAIDLVTGYKPQLIVMSKQMRRGIQVYLDSIGEKYPTSRDQYGNMIEYFRGIRLAVDDHIVDTETASSGAYSAKTGGGNTTIFILTFEPKACCGLQGPDGVETIDLGNLETKDATRTRIRWYCSLMFQDLRSCAKLDGIDADGTVTA
jgi:hypothetical protein